MTANICVSLYVGRKTSPAILAIIRGTFDKEQTVETGRIIGEKTRKTNHFLLQLLHRQKDAINKM
jgi:hypothetical protein